ncbi:MAG: o-succinylbenzoate synthase [Myxococcota bacterium]|nr:o-succinylbenzoate synthase [Myxococcota bacterium]
MTIVRGRLYAFALPLVAPLRAAHGIIEQREGFLVAFDDESGNTGCGEAMPLPSFGGEDLAACETALRAALCGLPPTAPAAATPVAGAAIECARLDLQARASGVSLVHALGVDTPASSVEVNALVSGDDAEAIDREVERLIPLGFETWKLKVGALPLPVDVARVRALRAAVGVAARIRLDANGGWSPVAACEAIGELADSGIELVEQPIAPGDPLALARLRSDSPVRIAADESVTDSKTLQALLAADAVDAVALKIPVLGGPRSALALASQARARGVDAYLTSFIDSSFGIAAALQVAAAFPGAEFAHGLATAALLSRNLTSELAISGGKLRVPDGAGVGLVPDAAALGEPIVEVHT